MSVSRTNWMKPRGAGRAAALGARRAGRRRRPSSSSPTPLPVGADRGQRPAGRPAAAAARRRPNIARTCSGTCAPASTSPRCNASSRPICARSPITTRSSPIIRASSPPPTPRSKAISGGSTAAPGRAVRRLFDPDLQQFLDAAGAVRLLPDRGADRQGSAGHAARASSPSSPRRGCASCATA